MTLITLQTLGEQGQVPHLKVPICHYLDLEEKSVAALLYNICLAFLKSANLLQKTGIC